MKKINKEFIDEASAAGIVWIGENHGVKENYEAYKDIISHLKPLGYTQLAWELPEDFEQNGDEAFAKYGWYEDGRINKEMQTFLKWCMNCRMNILCFDTPIKTGESQIQHEKDMALNLQSKIGGQKTIVVSGNFHSGTKSHQGIIPMSLIFEELTNQKILRIALVYKGGKFVNFGVKEITINFSHFDQTETFSGTLDRNDGKVLDDQWLYHAGIAHPVTLIR